MSGTVYMYILIKGRVADFLKIFFTCMYRLGNNMYNCIICFKNKFDMVRRSAEKDEHLHSIGFFRIVVLHHWMNASETI